MYVHFEDSTYSRIPRTTPPDMAYTARPAEILIPGGDITRDSTVVHMFGRHLCRITSQQTLAVRFERLLEDSQDDTTTMSNFRDNYFEEWN